MLNNSSQHWTRAYFVCFIFDSINKGSKQNCCKGKWQWAAVSNIDRWISFYQRFEIQNKINLILHHMNLYIWKERENMSDKKWILDQGKQLVHIYTCSLKDSWKEVLTKFWKLCPTFLSTLRILCKVWH